MVKAKQQKTVWSCVECGHCQSKWVGQCPQCNQWNSLHQEVALDPTPSRFSIVTPSKPVRIDEVQLEKTPRIHTHMVELDRLLGGGLVPGSLILVGGSRDRKIHFTFASLSRDCSPRSSGPLCLWGGISGSNIDACAQNRCLE